MPRTRLRHFFLHSILFHIFLGVVITLALVYLFDKETGSGDGQAGGRLEPIIVSVIDENDMSGRGSKEAENTAELDDKSIDPNEKIEKASERAEEVAIKKIPELKTVPAPKNLKKPEKKEAESVAENSAVTESDSNTLTKSDADEKGAETEGADSEKETVNTSPGELAYNVGEGARPNYGINPKPPYPKSARRRGQEGTVLLRVLVLEDGKVGEIELAGPSGYTVLDESALKAVKKWIFIPGKNGGEDISSWVEVPIKFQLDSG
jgi:TonB family protein